MINSTTTDITIIHLINDLNVINSGPSKSIIALHEQTKNYVNSEVWSLTPFYSDDSSIKSYESSLSIYFLKEILKIRKLRHVIHLHGMWHYNHLIIYLLSRFTKLNIVHSPRGSFSPVALKQGKKKFKSFFLSVFKILSKNIKAFIVTSENEKNDVKKIFPKIENFVFSNFSLTPSASKINKKLNQYIYVGRIDPIKNLKNLFLSWHQFSQLKSDTELIIIGDFNVKYHEELEMLIKKHNINNISFIGTKDGDKKFKYIQESKFLILPSLDENFGMVILEALLSNTPVLVSDKLRWNDVVDNKCGLIFDPYDVTSIVYSLKKSYELSYSEYQSMENNIKKYLMKKYPVDKISKEYVDFYYKFAQ
jgi:glycosyltransferase involved in cell wall biosynthesis